MNRLVITLATCSLLLSACNRDSTTTENTNILRIASIEDPPTLDPRESRNLENTTILHLLYEGLMRSDSRGKAEPAIAQKVEISEDQKIYTFTLKNTFWSNGDPLTATDFVETWKTILDPNFPAPNAYQLFVIKGAKAAKEGKIDLNQIGLRAKSPHTLVVELEVPTPYFQDLTSTHFYFPVHESLRTKQPKNNSSDAKLISNGPFSLESWAHDNEIVFGKNPKYWDAAEVTLEKVKVQVLSETTALRVFETGGLDWIGSPMGTLPQDAVTVLKHQKKLRATPGAGTHWFRLNTERPPFNNIKMRKAFAAALDRKSIVEHVTQGGQIPATGILPPSMSTQGEHYFQDNDVTGAWDNFQKALEEMHISKDDLPTITLCYGSSEREHKLAQAVQQQWQKAFGIPIELQSCEKKLHYDKLKRKDYQISSGSWFADFSDPINFLEVFKYKNNGTNNTQWENPVFVELLDQSALEKDPAKRKDILNRAEHILMDEMPVIPLFFSSFNYVRQEKLFGVHFSDLGYLDFKEAFFEDFSSEEVPD